MFRCCEGCDLSFLEDPEVMATRNQLPMTLRIGEHILFICPEHGNLQQFPDKTLKFLLAKLEKYNKCVTCDGRCKPVTGSFRKDFKGHERIGFTFQICEKLISKFLSGIVAFLVSSDGTWLKQNLKCNKLSYFLEGMDEEVFESLIQTISSPTFQDLLRKAYKVKSWSARLLEKLRI